MRIVKCIMYSLSTPFCMNGAKSLGSTHRNRPVGSFLGADSQILFTLFVISQCNCEDDAELANSGFPSIESCSLDRGTPAGCSD